MTMPADKPRILLADDEAHILHVVSLKLRNAGYEVMTAADGQEALELARAERPDLVITDYQMPQLTGLELCAELRAEEATRDIPALMLTARGFSLTDEDLARTNIAEVISKPFSPRAILTRVQELLTGTGAAASES